MASLTIRIPRIRHLRKGLTSLLRSRRRRLDVWLDDTSDDLDGTGTASTFTADNTLNVLTITAHGKATGDGPFTLSSTGALPDGLAANVLYWVRSVNVNTLSLYRSRRDAVLNQHIVSFSTDGTPTHSITPATTNQSIVELLRMNNSANRLTNSTDVDDFF